MTELTEKAEEYELKPLPFREQKLKGLKKRHSAKVAYILNIEKLWEDYAFNRTEKLMNRLLKALRFTIQLKSEYWGNRWRNKRLSASDFESIFYEVAFKLCDKYEWFSNFYFYETLLLIFERRATDLTRKIETRRGRFEASIVPLTNEADEFLPNTVDVETEVLNRDLVNQIINHETLTVQEKKLLQEIYNNPDASYKDWAEAIGLKHHQQVIRMLQRIKRKISHVFL
ncbi:hypothetical protein O0Q50_30630 [Priestia aryabhattai]|uniref:Sigma-70 family RNA polymerase sigma factor n=1 Tax=Priestia aryabhattai TaxID=412384 RepID=A0AAX6NI31_PRIAR|nr:hypothetical protein [Priestia aryabhattai]MDU9695561.1 hypothetical protein [Priestia aryabhattai]